MNFYVNILNATNTQYNNFKENFEKYMIKETINVD
jgi:hypothetical protein